MNTKEQLCVIMKQALPKDAVSESRLTDSVELRVFWYMTDDPIRTKKQSRNIIFVIPQKVVEDYVAQLDVEITSEIKKVIFQFNKKSNHGPNQTPPSETWVFDQKIGHFVQT